MSSRSRIRQNRGVANVRSRIRQNSGVASGYQGKLGMYCVS